MLATLTHDYFSDPDWIFEPKLDGIRCLAFKRGAEVTLLTRNKLRLNENYPQVVAALTSQPAKNFIVDGEIAATSDGRTSFGALQQRLHTTGAKGSRTQLNYHVFDVIHLDGRDVTSLPLLDRKSLLREFLSTKAHLKRVSHRLTKGEAYLEEACAKGWEGLIAKRALSTYQHGRSKDWLKFKCSNEQEFVLGGYTDPQGQRSGFGALLVGYYDKGDLRYAGKVGTGYNDAMLRELTPRLEALERSDSPFSGPPPLKKNVHWIRPRLVAQVGFMEWTKDGKLRHPRFIGLRTDKDPKKVVREDPS
jgi:bifunctional non-homologous end joining protein LigD